MRAIGRAAALGPAGAFRLSSRPHSRAPAVRALPRSAIMATAAQPARFAVAPETLDRLGAAMKPITGDDVFNMVRDAKVVLVGESRHAQLRPRVLHVHRR